MGEVTIFEAALEKASPEERRAYLDEACGGDATLRRSVEALLAAHDRPRGMLDTLPPAVESFEARGGVRVGSSIGPYKLLERIGEGGMGSVYMAEQERPVRRRVALKLIKPGMDSSAVIARFEAERQALALMDHPNIAKVLDAGTTDGGLPYFVMELVKGVPLTEYCDLNKLPPRARLELFIAVCQAVQHAHQKGIIHRDLKPGNVLVTLHDGRPVPKVIDFGVAKAVSGDRLTERTLFTSFAQMVGTPLYMSPEQAEMSALDVDTRSDVYSLGVLLYELLTGTTPFERERLNKAAYEEIRRIIREEEPPRPSTRLSTLGQTLTAISGNRATEPGKLGRLMRGELDWIVMRALEKDRTRRYETANGLARDVERYLKDEPVEARAPSGMYRFRKFARRHRVALAVGFSFALVLVVATVVSVMMAVRAKHAADAAESSGRVARDEAATSAAVLRFVGEDLLGQVDPYVQPDRDIKLRAVLDRAAEQLGKGLNNQPLVEATIREIVGNAYVSLGEDRRAAPELERALGLREAHLGPYHPDTLITKSNLGWAYLGMDDDKALRLFEEVLARRLATVGTNDEATIESMDGVGRTLASLERWEDSRRVLEDALARARQSLGPDHPRSISLLGSLSWTYGRGFTRNVEALQLQEERAARVAALHGPEHLSALAARAGVAMQLYVRRRQEEALVIYQEILGPLTARLGPDHPSVLATLQNMADMYDQMNRFSDAFRVREESQPLRVRKLGVDHPTTLGQLQAMTRHFVPRGGDRDATMRRFGEGQQYFLSRAESARLGRDEFEGAPASARAEYTAVAENCAALFQAAAAELDETPGPFGGRPHAIPGKLEAEHFDVGGQGVAYHDESMSRGEIPGRTTMADLKICNDEGGGHMVGGIVDGEWLTYTVEVAEEGEYEVEMRVATIGSNAKLRVEFDGRDASGPIVLPFTGGWGVWQTTVKQRVSLSAGRQVMRIVFLEPFEGHTQYVCNLNWVRITPFAAED